jgi:hypothetical protein
MMSLGNTCNPKVFVSKHPRTRINGETYAMAGFHGSRSRGHAFPPDTHAHVCVSMPPIRPIVRSYHAHGAPRLLLLREELRPKADHRQRTCTGSIDNRKSPIDNPRCHYMTLPKKTYLPNKAI